MTEKDFAFYRIQHFTAEEIKNTGSRLEDINVELIRVYDRYRALAGRRILLLPGGLTTGIHSSPLHAQGKAGDSAFFEADGPVNVKEIFSAALTAGAKGIGIYWNGTAYSVHLDIRENFSFWSGHKAHRELEWHYGSLIIDPKTLN